MFFDDRAYCRLAAFSRQNNVAGYKSSVPGNFAEHRYSMTRNIFCVYPWDFVPKIFIN